MPQAKTLHTINLAEAKHAPRSQRAGRAVALLKRYVERHHDTENIHITNRVNNVLWQDGVENPPTSITVQIVEKEETVSVEPVDHTPGTASTPAKEEGGGGEETAADSGAEQGLESGGELPDEVREVLETGTVSEAKTVLEDADTTVLEHALDVEEHGKNRKTLRRFITSRLQDEE